MNRIEQVVTPTAAQQSQPRLPRTLADVRRRAVPSFQPSGPASTRARRGTSGLAVAIAALTVPLLPGAAFGATSAVGGGGAAKSAAPHARHQLHHGEVIPGPGDITVRGWTAGGWTVTFPSGPAEPGLGDHALIPRHDDGCVPWRTETVESIGWPCPIILPDGTRGEISAYHVTRASPRIDEPQGPGTPTQGPAGPADSTGLTGPDGSTGSVPFGGAAEWSSGGPSAVRGTRSHVVPGGPLIPSARPANTKQMVLAPAANRSAARTPVAAASSLPVPACLRSANRVGKDHQMVAHLRPAPDAMDVVVPQRHAPCTARTGYLSQARA